MPNGLGDERRQAVGIERRRKNASAGAAAGWGVTGLLMLSLGSAAHAQAPSLSDEEAVAEAVAALRALPAEPGLPESAEVAEARAVQAREACRMIPNPTARAICTGNVGLAVALDIGIPTIIDWWTEDAEAMTRESREVLDRLGAVEERLDALEAWRETADDRFAEMNGKLGVIIELLRSR